MISRTNYLRELRRKLLHLKSDALTEFYYLEEENLLYKPDPKSWNILEVFEHLNLVNHFYIGNLKKVLPHTPEADEDHFRHSWLGRKGIQMMQPNPGKRQRKMKTFVKLNPVKLQQRGRILVSKVVFRDFIDGVEQLIALTEAFETKAIDRTTIPTIVPWLRLNIGDAIGFITAHTERHIKQAEKIARH